MSTALAILEKQFEPLAPRLAQALAGQIPVERLIRTVLISVERLPALLECDRQSLFMSAMSAACLGLEVDGVTGQAFLIPFKNKAQLVIGYKGYNTLAARGNLTITGAVVREGDPFEYEKGSSSFVRHKPLLGQPDRRIIGAWSVATHNHRPPIVEVLGIDELMATKGKSPGARRSDSPWNDPSIGFPAMCEKTAKRRLARSMPLTIMQVAARMDEAHEEGGKLAYVTPDQGLVVDGEAQQIGDFSGKQPTTQELIGNPVDDYAVEVGKRIKAGDPDLDVWWAETSERRIALNIPAARLAKMEAAVRKALNAETAA